MTIVLPAPARLIRPHWADRVPTPLHDALDPVTRATILATNPDSWLHVARRADDQASLDPHIVSQRSADALARLVTSDVYFPATESSFFLYRYHDDSHAQIGLVAHVPIREFTSGAVLGHEQVEAHRVRALVAHQRHLQMRGDLVALSVPDREAINELFADLVHAAPDVKITGTLGHEIWRVAQTHNARLTELLSDARLYIVDGHHRVAAAIEEWRSLGEPDHYSVLCLITPQSQLRALAFDRRIVGPILDRDPVTAIAEHGSIAPVDAPLRMPGHVGLYWDGRWYDLTLPPSDRVGVDALDVIRLHREVIEPVFGISAWADVRLEVTSERVGNEVLQYRCDNDGGAACILRGPSVAAIIDVANRGEQMPPKSTYFDPKPWSGVFLASPYGSG